VNEGELRVFDAPASSRYEARFGDRLAGFAEYEALPGRLIFTHTKVLPEFEGGGVGSRLAAEALGDARRRNLRITPECPFFSAYIRRHPQYADLVFQPDQPG